MKYLGDFVENTTDITDYFQTNNGSGAAVAPSSAFTNADFDIYKDSSATPKATTNGITVTSPLNSKTGLHKIAIDTNNDTGDSGFWTSGSDYTVYLDTAKTVDGETVGAVVLSFSIENRYQGAAAPTAAAIADAVWDEPSGGHVADSTMGLVQNEWENGGRLDNILDALTPGSATNITSETTIIEKD